MSYTPPAPGPYQADNVPSAQQRRRLPGTGMLITGLILLGISILGGIIAVVAFSVSSFGKLDDFAASTHSIDQPVTVDGLGNNQWYLYQDPTRVSGASCSVTDQQGNDVTNRATDLEMSLNDLSYESIQSFESTAAGVYEISCTDYPVVLGGSLPLGGLLGVGISVAVAVLVFIVGLVLTIVGLVRRSRAKNQQYPPNFPPYGGSPYPGYGPGQSPQYPTSNA